jgi:hypothetical protein
MGVLYNPPDVTDLFREIHPVDRVATEIWFAWQDRWNPAVDIDSSHRFLYGHRYWPRVKAAIAAAEITGVLVEDALRISEAATRTVRVDQDQLLGITAVGLRIQEVVGRGVFVGAPGRAMLEDRVRVETPSQVLQRRATNLPDGIFGRWRGDRRRWCVTVEPDADDTYVVTHGDMLMPCRGGNHEGCVVGILAGADHLSPLDGDEKYPLIRRACDCRVFGRVSLTYPPPPLRAASSRSI